MFYGCTLFCDGLGGMAMRDARPPGFPFQVRPPARQRASVRQLADRARTTQAVTEQSYNAKAKVSRTSNQIPTFCKLLLLWNHSIA
jgi:hypothetical protein